MCPTNRPPTSRVTKQPAPNNPLNSRAYCSLFVCFRTIFGACCSERGLPIRRRCTEVAILFARQCKCHRQANQTFENRSSRPARAAAVLRPAIAQGGEVPCLYF